MHGLMSSKSLGRAPPTYILSCTISIFNVHDKSEARQAVHEARSRSQGLKPAGGFPARSAVEESILVRPLPGSPRNISPAKVYPFPFSFSD